MFITRLTSMPSIHNIETHSPMRMMSTSNLGKSEHHSTSNPTNSVHSIPANKSEYSKNNTTLRSHSPTQEPSNRNPTNPLPPLPQQQIYPNRRTLAIPRRSPPPSFPSTHLSTPPPPAATLPTPTVPNTQDRSPMSSPSTALYLSRASETTASEQSARADVAAVVCLIDAEQGRVVHVSKGMGMGMGICCIGIQKGFMMLGVYIVLYIVLYVTSWS